VSTATLINENLVMDVLTDVGAISEADSPSDPIKWTSRRVSDFFNHPLLEGQLTEVTENQIRKRKTPQELFELFESAGQSVGVEEAEDPQEGSEREPERELNQTYNPKTLKINSLSLDVSGAIVTANCKCDGSRDLPDKFRLSDLKALQAQAFERHFGAIESCILSEVAQFDELDGLALTKIVRDTRGKGKNKVELFIFEAVDPEGAKANLHRSGEIEPGKMSKRFHEELKLLEEALLLIYRRPIPIVDVGDQQTLPVNLVDQGEPDESDETEEPIDD
jgi:hypothetical protein